MVTGLGYAFTSNRTLKQVLLKFVLGRLYRFAMKKNMTVLFQNHDDLEEFAALGCLIDTSTANVINGSGVDTTHYGVASLPDKPVFLMIARLLVNKGIREYSQASKIVRQTHPDARFLLIGFLDPGPDGISATELDSYTESGIEYLGEKKDVRSSIANCSIYVLPSYREGTPRSVLEAMSMGRPIITTDVPGCKETVLEGKNGFLVPARNSKQLAEAMKSLADDQRLRSEFGTCSRTIAEQKYNVKNVNRDILRYLGMLA